MNAKVLIVMGSDSDLPVMEATAKLLDEFNIQDIHLVANDKGAINQVIEARLETALYRASNNQRGTI